MREASGLEGTETTRPEECRLGFLVTVKVGKSETMLALHWLEGHDQALFESFGGFLQRKVRDLGTNGESVR